MHRQLIFDTTTSEISRFFTGLLLALSLTCVASAQTRGQLRGRVLDPSGAVMPRATVRLQQSNGRSQVMKSDQQGQYLFADLLPGRYTLTVTAPGFTPFTTSVTMVVGQTRRADIHLLIASQTEKLQVNAAAPHIDLAPQSNASAVVITGRSLDALSNDPDELQSQLSVLAGPSVGPGGGQIYINGFTRGDLPPKSEIREIRVNSDPFAVQNERLGYGRIDIDTKPGGSSFHGGFSTQYNNSSMNALSPFLNASGTNSPSYHTLLWNGELGGPLTKKSSFYIDVEQRNINRANLVNTEILGPNLNIVPYVNTVANPRTLFSGSGRLDYQLTPSNTLAVRYEYFKRGERNSGVDTQTLPSQAYNYNRYHHNLQIFDSQTLGPRVVNEARFQYLHFHDVETPQSLSPEIDVLGAFLGGGSSNGSLDRHESHYEFRDGVTMSLRHHLIQFGGWLRGIRRQQDDTANFNGTFTFNSLSDYQQTEQALQNGMTVSQIQAAGYGPSQFNITTGNLSVSVNRIDGALFAGDTWALRPSLSFSYGLRFEAENVGSNAADWAPRLGIAWAPGHGDKTVLRAGWGLFYSRFDDDQMIIAARLNGTNQLTYIVNQPDFFPNPPSVSSLNGAATSLPAVYRIAPNLHLPYDMDTAVSVEHQLLPSTTVSLTYLNSRGYDQFLTNDINAPLPGTFNPTDPASGVRPLGNSAGNIYEYQSTGIYRQNQLIANAHVNSRRVSVFGYYVFNDAHSDTAGVSTFATNPWNIRADYGRARFDVRHRLMIGSTVALPVAFRLSSVVIANSGLPFSITLPQDLYGTGIRNARPAFAAPSTPAADLAVTSFGTFNIAPAPNDVIIPPNTQNGPANFMVNLRLSRTFGLGSEGGGRRGGGGTAAEAGGHHDHRRGLGGRGLSGGGGFGLGGATRHRYALTLYVSVLNLFNTVNLAPPVSVIGSPLIGQSLSLATGPFAAQVGNPVANRLVNVGASFSF